MTFVLYLAWTWSLVLLRQTAAVPTVQSLHSDLTIVQHNDLYGSSSSRSQAAILLSSQLTQQAAASACNALGEQLWTTPSNASQTDFLAYLDSHDTASSADLFWVAASSGCNAISKSGHVQTVACTTQLPALCSQTAPLSSMSSIDSSAKWRTSVVAGSQTITGFRDKLSFRFQGIRYAPKPERFTYSTVHEGAGNASALDFGSICMQSSCSSSSSCSEDCLFLNVWTSYLPQAPQTAPKLRPVLFWIHGGAFVSGFGSDPTFDGANLASRGDVVVVTINYRLSTLGFLALDDGVTKGNFGIADQITALEWVRANIKAFGGDPDKITIFGQSAGGASVRALLGSPKAIGKFHGAIPMSNPGGLNYASSYSKYYTIPEEVAVAGNPVLTATGCANATDELACLRSYDALKLVSLPTAPRYVVIDGTYIKDPQLEVTGNVSIAHVPVLMGVMRDDGDPFITYLQTTNLSESITAAGFNTSQIISSGLFPEPQSQNATLDVFNVTSRVATDADFRCIDQASAYAAARTHTFPSTYFYEFNRSYQLSGWSPNPPTCEAPKTVAHPNGDPSQEYFKCHSGELYYVFGSLYFNELPPRDDFDIPFSQYIVDTWSAFARTGDPNPDLTFLENRGYTNTTGRVKEGGRWEEVTSGSSRGVRGSGAFGYGYGGSKANITASMRRLQWEMAQVTFNEQEQCDLLGLPLTYYFS